ncbi:MAG: FMN-binding protein, partial [Clostridiales bacterium]|nr:FMN-binding protein [Clostridiales bacterium]
RIIMADVEVKVIEITILKHEYGRGYKAEKIIDDIVEKQLLDEDSVSSSTLSSKIIRKAIENEIDQ